MVIDAEESCAEKILISFFNNIIDKKRTETLLNVIERVYTKTPWMQKLEDESMIDICKEEKVSPEQVFFALLCC